MVDDSREKPPSEYWTGEATEAEPGGEEEHPETLTEVDIEVDAKEYGVNLPWRETRKITIRHDSD